jgi:hypothetical protein
MGDKNTYDNIMCKIREFIVLDAKDLEFIKTLSREQLFAIIEITNVYTELLS